MRRKSKPAQGASASANGDDGSAVSKSSKKSFMGKLMKSKKSKSKGKSKGGSSRDVSQNENDTAAINDSNAEADKQAEVQKAFLKNGQEAAKKPYMLKIALLLVDAKTRRFELLQLEFDSDKALVSDALSQIPIHVTEKVLSSQTYTGVCGASGVERKRSVPLFDFCKGNDVLVAIPSGTNAEECARLAKPILSDEKVIGMLSTSGINADPWTTAPIAAPRSSSSSRTRQAPKTREVPKKSGSSTVVFYVLIAVLIAAAAAYWYHTKSDLFALVQEEKVVGEPPAPPSSFGPQVDLEPVWSSCQSFCEASRGFVEKYIVSPPSK